MKKAILLVNLGSPDSYAVKDVRRYLGEFLMDERVIDFPHWLRTVLIKGVILNTRPKKSAAAYESIWWDEGSPLMVLSKRLHLAVQKETELPVALGMRYGTPSIYDALRGLQDENPDLESISLIPLYPHYAMSSYETVVVKAREVVEEHFPHLNMMVRKPFYNDPDYVEILAKSLKDALPAEYDQILFSYHGVPERQIKKSDVSKGHCLNMENCCQKDSPVQQFCYRHQTTDTTRLVVEKLNLDPKKYSTSFQSRLGPIQWLTPYTDKTIEDFAKQGVKKLVILCPAFVSDCLETIEEIGLEARESFIENGGEEFTLVPCLNDQADWVKLIVKYGEEMVAHV
jgi:ferrochelatase